MIDGPDRRERLLNLLAALLHTRRGLTREELVELPELGYPGNPESARKQFERDKAALRAMGVPLREQVDGDEHRYRVVPSEYYLPDLGLDDEELAALHVAVSAVGLGTPAAEGALMKLGGREGEPAEPVARLPMEDGVAELFEAARRRAPVRFWYRTVERDLEPWALASRRGHWYVVGHERGAGGVRVFRVDRIEGPMTVGSPGGFDVPAGFRVDAHLADPAWRYGPGPPTAVRVRVDRDHAAAFLAAAGPDAASRRGRDGSVVVTLEVTSVDGLRSLVLDFLEHAEVLDPPHVRAAVVEWLRALAAEPKAVA